MTLHVSVTDRFMIVTLTKSHTPVSRDSISPRHVGGSSDLDPKALA